MSDTDARSPGDSAADDEVGYPPRHHLLRELPFEMEDTAPERARGHLRLVDELAVHGRLGAGPVLVVTDVLAGLLVGRVIAPDWMATAQLSLHLTDPPALSARTADPGDLLVDAVVRRAGRTTIVVEAALLGGPDGPHVGEAMLTFVRLPRRDGNLDIGDTPVSFGRRVTLALPDSGLAEPYSDAIGVRVVDAGAGQVELAASEYVRNSFGAVNGGVVASVAVDAAAAVAAEVLGGPARSVDLVATYLSQGKVGPLVTRSAVLRRDATTVLVRVEVLDGGTGTGDGVDEPRVVVIAHVHCVAA